MEDIDVIRKIKQGDTDAYALLVEKYHRSLLQFIFKVVGDRELVEDIGQDVFLTVYTSLGEFDEDRGTPFAAWLYIAAKNRCFSVLKAKIKRSEVSMEDSMVFSDKARTAEDVILDKERMDALKEALGCVPEPFRETIVLSLGGYSMERIGEMGGVSTGTVKSRLFRARERLKTLVTAYFGR